jgi:hypothetical protein
MPKIKDFQFPMTGVTRKRLQLLDARLGGEHYFETRKQLLNEVNRLLPVDGKISYSTLDQDIRGLKNEIERRGLDVPLRQAGKGYRYSEMGFSLFKDTVQDKEVFQMKWLLDMAWHFTDPDHYTDCIRMAEKMTGSCPTKNPSEEFKRKRCFMMDASLTNHEKSFLNRLLVFIESESTLRIKVRTAPEGTAEIHMSPLTLIWRRDGLWVAGILQSKKGKHGVRVIAVSTLLETDYSSLPFQRPEDFDPVALLEDIKRYRLRSEDIDRATGTGYGDEGPSSLEE